MSSSSSGVDVVLGDGEPGDHHAAMRKADDLGVEGHRLLAGLEPADGVDRAQPLGHLGQQHEQDRGHRKGAVCRGEAQRVGRGQPVAGTRLGTVASLAGENSMAASSSTNEHETRPSTESSAAAWHTPARTAW